MSQKLIRVYQELDLHEVTAHLLVYGDLSGACAHCQAMDIKLAQRQCPQCHSEFKYIAFRNIKSHYPKVHQLKIERPEVVIIDHEDYKHVVGAWKAEEFLK
ncbi:MAG: hypothetical protein WC450_00835 [Candidatus Omnitrophota bacterium]|jgi:Zn finger protein HypA/HybF involved in hydrogenase expression